MKPYRIIRYHIVETYNITKAEEERRMSLFSSAFSFIPLTSITSAIILLNNRELGELE